MLVDVDPTRIERSVIETASTWPQWGRVVGGDWDREWEPFDERAVARGIRQRFAEGRAWRQTALFDAYVDQLERFGTAWGYTSLDAFERRCAEVEALYESIRTRGYRRQRALRGGDRGATVATRTDEINVDVARDGTLCWRAYGQHRLAMAKVLDVETVPVLVHRRHRGWQDVRERVRSEGGEFPATVLNHPDLRDVVEMGVR